MLLLKRTIRRNGVQKILPLASKNKGWGTRIPRSRLLNAPVLSNFLWTIHKEPPKKGEIGGIKVQDLSYKSSARLAQLLQTTFYPNTFIVGQRRQLSTFEIIYRGGFDSTKLTRLTKPITVDWRLVESYTKKMTHNLNKV